MEIYTVGMGGTGMTLAIVIAILLFMKSKQMKQISKLGLAPGIFNVNEPVIFGLPIVMNPIIIIPWVIAPMVVTLVTYLAMSAGIVPPPTGVTVPWTVPFSLTGLWRPIPSWAALCSWSTSVLCLSSGSRFLKRWTN